MLIVKDDQLLRGRKLNAFVLSAMSNILYFQEYVNLFTLV